MRLHISYVLFLLWFSYLIISSILLFTRGFLLSRTVQSNNSTCLSYKEVPCPNEQTFLTNITNGYEEECVYNDKVSTIVKEIHNGAGICLQPKARVVLLIVDALRYDFTLYDDKNVNPAYYQNKLPVIGKLREEHPESTRLYKFIADPPTTTMQRLKALTTGSLPTFIDAGSNFATYEINEDNLIDQINRNGYRTVFMGDDTWNGLYPNRFLRNYPYPSFDVWDLDTVDNGVVTNLFPELKNTDWNLLIGHFLGVDHVGHKHGPGHPEMSRKLGEINDVIEQITNQIDKNTMLFVIGDHGMTVTGDHGGESPDEVTAGMFVYSKENLANFADATDSVKQVDLVPTLSAILGIPIPFQNLGSIILNCLPLSNKTERVEDWQLSLYSMWANVQQILDYIKAYSRNTDTFKDETLKPYYEKYSLLKSKLLSVDSEDKFREFTKDLSAFIVGLRVMCEEVWVQFDSYQMTRGLLFLFLSMFFTFTIVDGVPSNAMPAIFQSSFIFCTCIALMCTTLFVTCLYYMEIIDNLMLNIFFANGVISQFMLVMLIVQNWDIISTNWHERRKLNKTSNVICRIILVFNVCGVFSNSYIIEESYVLLFLLVTVILVGTLGISSSSNTGEPKKKSDSNTSVRWSKIKLFILALCIAGLVRCTQYFWRCREEQQWCFATPHEVNNITMKVETSKVQYIITLICMGVFVFVTKVWLRECGNLNGYSINVLLATYMPSVLVVCIAGYWGINKLPNQPKKVLNPYISENILAWIVYGFTYFGLVSIIFDPLCVYILPRKDGDQMTINPESNIIPQLFNKIKKAYTEKKTKDDIPIVCGLGTVYSAVYVIAGVYLSLVFCLLLGDFVSPSAVVMFLTAGFVLIITSVLRIEQTPTIESLFDVPHISILVWVILSQYFFYGTGHQAAFPNINWESAFVGLKGVSIYNYVPAGLVIVNTFCSYFLMGFLLPLVLIAPFNVFVMIPSVIGKKHDLQTASQRGEVLLYERDKVMVTSAFNLSCKYIMCHGLRVFASMLSATIHCRHLMVWKIFAPKLIFESIGMFVTLGAVALGYLVLLRINKKVDRLVTQLNKMS